MKVIALIGYRNWAFQIFKNLIKYNKDIKFILISQIDQKKNKNIPKNWTSYFIDPKNNNNMYKILNKNKVSAALFYGWSWIIKNEIIQNNLCICLHPSKLPKYRGGSPIQHQIINGERFSAVTLFKMDKTIDGGDIYAQKQFSLNGTISEIFKRIEKIGFKISNNLINDIKNNSIKFKKQKNKSKVYKRRNKSESEIKISSFKKMSYIYFNNFVRMLDDPYPNAFFKIKEKKIIIKKIKKMKTKHFNKILFDFNNISIKKGVYIKLKDSIIKVTKMKIV